MYYIHLRMSIDRDLQSVSLFVELILFSRVIPAYKAWWGTIHLPPLRG